LTPRLSQTHGAPAAKGGKVDSEVLDVADRAAVERCIAAAAKRHGGLDTVIANAGFSAGPGPGELETAWVVGTKSSASI
jgi:NAD(P)-dependent dehydrogenase (short-subunit alcohol dehydrogenase family)